MGALLNDDVHVEDRRQGLRLAQLIGEDANGAGQQGNGRTRALAVLRARAEVGVKDVASEVIAIRGERVALVRTIYSGLDQRADAFVGIELLRIAEVDVTDGSPHTSCLTATTSTPPSKSSTRATSPAKQRGIPGVGKFSWAVLASSTATRGGRR